MSYESRPWSAHYDPGVPQSLAPYPDVPLFHFLRKVATEHPQTTALLTSAQLPVLGRQKATISYQSLDRLSDALAVALVNLGVHRGDAVALMMPNCAQFAIGVWGIFKAGGVVSAVNPTYPAAKVQHQLKDCGARIGITLSLFYPTIKQARQDTELSTVIVANIKEYLPPVAAALFTLAKEKKEGHRVEIGPGDLAFSTLIKQVDGEVPDVRVEAADLALYQYTGGTTGTPKGAMITHRALVCNAMQLESWLGADTRAQSLMGAIPMFHVFGMVAVLATAARLAAPIFLVPNPRDVVDLLQVMHTYKPTIFHGVPAMYNAIVNNPDVLSGKYDLKSIRTCISGSAPLPSETKERFERITGGKLVEGYGMSEMPTATHVNPLVGENKTGSIGLPVPDVEARIVDLLDGRTEVPVGEVGELIVRGPQMMAGYYGQPQETDYALRLGPDDRFWMYTGDIAYMDQDGYFYIVDRKKDMAIIGGFNVYPNNVERALMKHPAVQESSVAAIPHPNPEKVGQEALYAWVVLRPDRHCTAQELIEFAQLHLARYEVPTRIEFLTALPKTAVGKILRRELVQMELRSRQKNDIGTPTDAAEKLPA